MFLCVLIQGQTHSIDNQDIMLEGPYDSSDISENTFYNALEDVNVNWEIIELSGPSEWQYSFCFPVCYDIGVTEGEGAFTSGSEQFLNCHVYPNNTTGSGLVKMKLTTNTLNIDTVTWHVTAIAPLSVANIAITTGTYPNPASTSFTIAADERLINAPYRLYNAHGKLVLEGTILANNTLVHTESLSSGSYTLSISNGDQVVTETIVIQK
jgi:hypothetical protein